MEKVEALALITTKETAFEVVKEIAEYCEDVQPKFVRACIRSIGQIACRIPDAADYCVQSYMTLLTGENEKKEKLNYKLPSFAAQELLVSIQDIFRTYPDRYEGVIVALCESIMTYDDPNAKASLVWILGEYCTRIEGVEDILIDLLSIDLESQMVGQFVEDPVVIQLAVITAVTKIFIATKQEKTQLLFKLVTGKAMAECLSPDVRSRAAFYQRLIAMDQTMQLAQQVVFVQKPAPVYSDGLSAKLEEQLSNQLGSIPATLREIVVFQQNEVIDSEEIVKQFGGIEPGEDTITAAQVQVQAGLEEKPKLVV